MNDETDAESASNTTTDDSGSSSYGSAIFSRSHHFTVAGGTFNNNFNNVTNNYTSTLIVPSDFRMIPMGDIDLLEEICLNNETGVVGRHHPERTRVRRMYSARVDGRKSGVTVAMYQGDGAEEEWRQDIANYMTIRHPNIVQMCGAASSGGIHATLFHDDLIPFENFVDYYHHSPILQVYIYGYCSTDFMAVRDYFFSVFQQLLWEDHLTVWIHRSSGRLCADLIPSNTQYWSLFDRSLAFRPGIKSLDLPNEEVMAINALTLEQYHQICYWDLSRHRKFYCSASATVNLNAISVCASGDRLEDLVEIALLLDGEVYPDTWETMEGVRGEVMEGGWTRFASDDIFDSTLNLYMSTWRHEFWFSQANHIFSRLGITSNFEDHAVITSIYFHITISPVVKVPPIGYLFLCPPKNLRTSPSSFRWPECPAYWSLDPSGVEHLSMEDATRLGFPSISLSTNVYGKSWDAIRTLLGISIIHFGNWPVIWMLRSHMGEEDQDPLGMDESDDTHMLSSEDDGESTDTDDWAIPLASAEEAASRAEEEMDPDPPILNKAENSQKSAKAEHTPESTKTASQGTEPSNLDEEIPASWTFKFFMNIQLTLILFLALCSLTYPSIGLPIPTTPAYAITTSAF
ncbi:hypothetical protein B0H13DRAFT_2565184 [Mycena leptocephala]|nr:hypothetical protein B0H13DRAFT_2565184 [Mycena leptocephala]